jgi:hypothetical protein
MSAGNVVQLGVCNVACLPVAEAAQVAGMDCAGGEVSPMAAADPAALAGIAQGGAGDQVRGAAGAACHGPSDVQSAVFVLSYEGGARPCHTPRHERADLDAGQAGLGRVAGAETDRGGGGSGARARACCTIGLGAAENFRNGSSSRRTPAPKKEGGAVEAVRPYGRKAVFARVVRTGQIVLVKLGRGLHAERFPFPCWLQAQQVDGAWIYAGPVPEPRCPQCLSRHNTDCYEQPCGWSEKKKGGAA